jgi:hypothetical protein
VLGGTLSISTLLTTIVTGRVVPLSTPISGTTSIGPVPSTQAVMATAMAIRGAIDVQLGGRIRCIATQQGDRVSIDSAAKRQVWRADGVDRLGPKIDRSQQSLATLGP